jgi:uncharacterized protein
MAVAVVTGASRGLGLELVLRLSAERAVVGVSRGAPGDERWRRLEAENKACHVAGDVAEPATVAAAFRAAERLGTVDVVVNCAGSGVFGPAAEIAPPDLVTTLRANLVGLILFSQGAYARLATSGGTLVNVLSTAARLPRANETLYCASKWGARGFTESLRLEAAGSAMSILAVYPGGMRTSFWRQACGQPAADGSRFMDPSEVAAAIVAALPRQGGAIVSELTIVRPPSGAHPVPTEVP